MHNHFVDVARHLTKIGGEIPRTAWLRANIAAIPASPAFRPHCCQNYASDLGVRYRPDPKIYLTEVLKSINYIESDTMSPQSFFQEWVHEGSDELVLAHHFDALINFAGEWEFAGEVAKLFWTTFRSGNDLSLLTYCASAASRVDIAISEEIYRYIESRAYSPGNQVMSRVRHIAKLIKRDGDLDAAAIFINQTQAQIDNYCQSHSISSGDSAVYHSIVDNIHGLLLSKLKKYGDAYALLTSAAERMKMADGLVTIEEDPRLRYFEQIQVNRVQLLLLQDRLEEALNMARRHADWVKSNHDFSLSEALHILGYAEYLCMDYHDAKGHWEEAMLLSAEHGLVTPLNALRKGLSVVYGKLGNDDRSIEVYKSISTDPAGIKLSLKGGAGVERLQ